MSVILDGRGRERFDSVGLRFWSKVELTSDDQCWIWRSTKLKPGGYGVFSDKSKSKFYVLAHRWAYEFLVGEIAPRLTVDHLCRTRECVNPSHMEIVTRGENAKRAPTATYWIQAAKTHCRHGHEFTAENTRYRTGRGRVGRSRRCLACQTMRNRLRKFVDGRPAGGAL